VHRQRGLERVLVAHIVGVFADGQLRIAALEFKPSRIHPDQARDQAKERGLAHAIGAGDEQGFAGVERKAQAFEDQATAPDAGKIGAGEAHHRLARRSNGPNPTSRRKRDVRLAPSALPPIGKGRERNRGFLPMLLASVDFLE